MREGASTSDLMAHAARHDFQVSPHQIRRLHREGLLSRPVQVHSRGQAGSTAVYPEPMADQLIGVLQLRRLGYRTFRDLRIASWLDGLDIEFKLLQPDVVALLRREVKGSQGLNPKTPDEDLVRRLAQLEDQSVTRKVAQFKRSLESKDMNDVVLATFQIGLDTDYAAVAGETFDAEFDLATGDRGTVSNLYHSWDIPSVAQWPRIISRTGKKWFAAGPTWIRLAQSVLDAYSSTLPLSSPSPGAAFVLDHANEGMLSQSPTALQARNFIACQGVVLARHNSDQLLAMFNDGDK